MQADSSLLSHPGLPGDSQVSVAHPRVSRGLCSSQSPRDPHWLKHHPWENLAMVGKVEKNPPALKCFFPTVKDFSSAVSLAKQVRKPASLQGHQSVQFSSVALSCPTLCDPMDCSTPGFPVHHQLPELAATHIHPVGEAI